MPQRGVYLDKIHYPVGVGWESNGVNLHIVIVRNICIVCFLKNTPFAMFLRYFESRNSAEELVRNFVGSFVHRTKCHLMDSMSMLCKFYSVCGYSTVQCTYRQYVCMYSTVNTVYN
jgi:hypothetical protein